MTHAPDAGPAPFVTDIEQATLDNDLYRVTLWTGSNLQLTVMAIPPGGDIGLEVHGDHDQFLRIEAGTAKVLMGPAEDRLQTWSASADWAIFVPAGSWHNVVNTGETTLKLYSIYSPPEHPHGTVHRDQAEAMAAEADHH